MAEDVAEKGIVEDRIIVKVVHDRLPLRWSRVVGPSLFSQHLVCVCAYLLQVLKCAVSCVIMVFNLTCEALKLARVPFSLTTCLLKLPPAKLCFPAMILSRILKCFYNCVIISWAIAIERIRCVALVTRCVFLDKSGSSVGMGGRPVPQGLMTRLSGLLVVIMRSLLSGRLWFSQGGGDLRENGFCSARTSQISVAFVVVCEVLVVMLSPPSMTTVRCIFLRIRSDIVSQSVDHCSQQARSPSARSSRRITIIEV